MYTERNSASSKISFFLSFFLCFCRLAFDARVAVSAFFFMHRPDFENRFTVRFFFFFVSW